MKSSNLIIRIVGVIVLIGCLLLIRKYQTELFYDPFLKFFADDNTNKMLPAYDGFQMYASLIFRYALNSTISVLIIGLIFWDKNIVVTGIKIYVIVGVIFLIIYMMMVEMQFPLGEKIVFYIRRILIQPFLLLVLIPTFYVLQQKEKDE